MRPCTRAVRDAGYTQATECSSAPSRRRWPGQDLMVSASTGSGKTASFILPALQRVLAARADDTQAPRQGRGPRPARAGADADARTGACRSPRPPSTTAAMCRACAWPPSSAACPIRAQLKALRGPLDMLIATPGRLIDHLQTRQGRARPTSRCWCSTKPTACSTWASSTTSTLIAEPRPNARQTRDVQRHLRRPRRPPGAATAARRRSASTWPRTPTPTPTSSSACTGPTTMHAQERAARPHPDRARASSRRWSSPAPSATPTGWPTAWPTWATHVASLHGGMPQGRRNRVLQGLRTRHLRVLVATDVAARGIDVPTISHVINYGLPMKAEDYVHRIGRTGRAGRNGLAVTLAERRDAGMIRRIQHFTTQRIPVGHHRRPGAAPRPSRSRRSRSASRRRRGKPRRAGFGPAAERRPGAGRALGQARRAQHQAAPGAAEGSGRQQFDLEHQRRVRRDHAAGAARAVAQLGGISSTRVPPTFMPCTPSSQPRMTWPAPRPKRKGSPRSLLLSNLRPRPLAPSGRAASRCSAR